MARKCYGLMSTNHTKESFPLVPIHDISMVIRTPAPKSHRQKLAQPVQDLLEDTEEALRGEIRKCIRIMTQLLPTSDGYDTVAVRLAGFLRDYMRVSGADEAEAEAKEVRKAIIGVEAFMERQLRQQNLSGERERKAALKERHLKAVQTTDVEADSLEALGKLGETAKVPGWGGESGGEGYDSEGAELRRRVQKKQKVVDVSEEETQNSDYDADGLFQI